MSKKTRIVVIGGGTAGIMVAARMLRKDASLDIKIVEPAEYHYYQPAWTLVGAGTYDYAKTKRPMASLIPKGAEWIQDACTGFDPDNNTIKTAQSGDIPYDYLVVASGLMNDPSMIEGLEEAFDKGVVCSNYTDPDHVWDVLQNFKGGNALFTQPTTPIKCGGAPQKITYLASDYFRKKGILKKTNVIFATPGTVVFGVPKIAATLQKVIDRYGIHFQTYMALRKVDAEKKIAYYEYIKPEGSYVVDESKGLGDKIMDDGMIAVPFDMMHLAPPERAHDFVHNSKLVNAEGWLDVDTATLQHNTYKNIFGLGDVAALPTAKTGAAIRKQAPIVSENIFRMMKTNAITDMQYNGYSSCPLVTGYGKMVLAEFDYDNNFTPDPKLKQMLIFDSSKEHWRLWILKKYMLPYLYWNKMMKGIDV